MPVAAELLASSFPGSKRWWSTAFQKELIGSVPSPGETHAGCRARLRALEVEPRVEPSGRPSGAASHASGAGLEAGRALEGRSL